MSSTCLLVVDVQQALFAEAPDDCVRFLDALASLLGSARERRIPVAVVQHSGPPGDECEPGTPGWELHPLVRPRDGEPVFAKRFNSAFKETGLEDWLRERGITTLVIAGMQTEHCLDATIKSAFERGFRVIVPEGAHTTFDNGGLTADQIRQWYAGRIWHNRYAQVRTVAQVTADFTAP